MKNLVLKQGDFVRYIGQSTTLNMMGFMPRECYLVQSVGGALIVQSRQPNGLSMPIILVDLDNIMTDYALEFTKLKEPMTLPKGAK